MNPTMLAVLLMAVLGHQVSAHHYNNEVREASSDFSQTLQPKLSSDTKKSLVLSPIILHSSLCMTRLGARNETAEEMERTLNISSLLVSEVHEEYREILTELEANPDVRLEIVNAMYVNSDKEIRQEFKDKAARKYLAKIDTFDASEPEPEKKINDYVSEKTEGEIKEIIKKGSIDSRTSVVLVSTISFNASFQERFDESKTRKREFTCENGKKGEVEMMNDTRSALHKRDDDTDSDVLSMPFKNERQSLIVVLPRKPGQLETLEKRLSEPGKVTELLKGLKPRTVEIGLPKFKINSRFELKEKLREMGMERAFDSTLADFSGISESEHLHLSEVTHSAVIEIDENGTRAAAATVVEIENRSQPKEEQEAEEHFCADHGFLFFIQDNTNKQLLFQGIYTGPKKERD